MTARKLHLAFLWHMHQPYYRNDITGETIMPWVRLHSLQNYYDIPNILTSGNNLRMTFNLVPSLLLQINNMIDGGTDSFEQIARVPAEELTDEQKTFILKNFFMIHPNKISRFPRFSSLWEKRGKEWHSVKDNLNPRKFSASEFRDLQVLYHLSWCGWKLQEDEDIAGLNLKGSSFTEEEKAILLDKQKAFISEIIPLYKRLQNEQRIESSTSPFYHPILPLLIDQNISQKSSPGLPLPGVSLKLENDAEAQLRMGLDYFASTLGSKSSGIWPSEGSVSEDALRVASKCGIRWAATDDEILRKSLNKNKNDMKLEDYLMPYAFNSTDAEMTLFFRNHYLSDRLGFSYSRMTPSHAAEDFLNNLKWILDNSSIPDPLVCVILDGENAWEFYPDNGKDFLSKFGETIDQTDWIETETFSSYIDKFSRKQPKLERIYPGSWIYGNFSTWIGHSEKNKAWELLLKTRMDAEIYLNDPSIQEKNKERIKNEFYIAEGSDWFWWYGDDHHTEFSAEFDSIFRQHLINIYRLCDKVPPKILFESILEAREFSGVTEPVSFISPSLDGMNGSFFEWRGSGTYNPHISQGAIHRTNFCINQIKFGFNTDYLFIRIKTAPQSSEQVLRNNTLEISFIEPRNMSIKLKSGEQPRIFIDDREESYSEGDLIFRCSHSAEVGIKWGILGLKSNDKTEFNISLKEISETIERHPANTNIKITVPDASFEERNWVV